MAVDLLVHPLAQALQCVAEVVDVLGHPLELPPGRHREARAKVSPAHPPRPVPQLRQGAEELSVDPAIEQRDEADGAAEHRDLGDEERARPRPEHQGARGAGQAETEQRQQRGKGSTDRPAEKADRAAERPQQACDPALQGRARTRIDQPATFVRVHSLL